MTIRELIGCAVASLIILGSTPALCKHGIMDRRDQSIQHVWLSESEISILPQMLDTAPENMLPSLGLKEVTDPYSLHLETNISRPSGRVLTYRQYYYGYKVIGASVKVCLNNENQPISWSINLLTIESENDQFAWIKDADVVHIAQESINLLKLRSNIRAEKIVLPQNGIPKFCWRIKIPASNPLGDWDVYIAANSGDVLLVEDRLQRINGVGLVFLPDPKTALHDSTLTDDNDRAEAVPEDAYTEVDLLEISSDDDDLYILTGPWVDTEPTEDRVRLEEAEFMFDREDDQFEEVMAYYHIDNQARYFESLGLGESLPNPLPVDVNGLEEDVSFFSPHTGILTTGTGGVDDAEDADVLVHEYGHAVIFEILGDWQGGETALLSEGLCDYFAGGYSLELDSEFQPFDIFNWDGHNEFWAGRILNSTLTYDEIFELNHHEAGQLWSSLLIEVLLRSEERDSWNQIVLDHIAALSDSSTIPLAAEALMQSDQELTGGEFRQTIVQACLNRNVFMPGFHNPVVSHQPLNDIEDIEADRLVLVTISSNHLLDADRLWLIYASEQNEPDTLLLENYQDVEDQYFTHIPAPGVDTDVEYYFVATDTSGVFTIDPPGAPLFGYRFHIGADRTPPTIFHSDTLRTTVFSSGEVHFSAKAFDNIGIDQVGVRWFDSQMEERGSVELFPVQDHPTEYSGIMRWDMGEARVIFYQVFAIDSSEAGNITNGRALPMELVNNAMIENFDSENHRWNFENWGRIQYSGRDSSWVVRSNAEPEVELPILATLTLADNWDLSGFLSFKLYFWEHHRFDNDSDESGSIEISVDGGESWEVLFSLRGYQRWWRRYEIDLDPYTGEGFDSISIRFATEIVENENPDDGWYIDEIFATTRSFVSNNIDVISPPVSFFISNPFPNPTNGNISLNYRLPSSGYINLYDMNGRLVANELVAKGIGQLNFSIENFSSGTYIILMRSSSNTVQKTVIILK